MASRGTVSGSSVRAPAPLLAHLGQHRGPCVLEPRLVEGGAAVQGGQAHKAPRGGEGKLLPGEDAPFG